MRSLKLLDFMKIVSVDCSTPDEWIIVQKSDKVLFQLVEFSLSTHVPARTVGNSSSAAATELVGILVSVVLLYCIGSRIVS
jgi:hypothetical protein